MTRAELQRMIREEIKLAADVLLAAKSGNSKGKFEDIQELYPGMPTMQNRATMRPFGFVSRAPAGTTSVVGRQSAHQGNRIVLGHRDENAPDLDNEGDVMLYNASGAQIYLNGGKVMVGSRNASKGAARINDPVTLNGGAALIGQLVGPVPSVPIVSGQTVTLTLANPLPNAGFIAQGSANVLVED